MTITDKIAPIHPGEVLLKDFIEGFGITQNKVAVAIGVPPRRINEIVHGQAKNHSRYSCAPCPLLRHNTPVLAEPANHV